MGIRNFRHLKNALHAPVLAPRAVQRIESHVGLEFRQPEGQVMAGIQLGDPVACFAQCGGAGPAGDEADLPFRRQTAHQHCHVNVAARRVRHELLPNRRISHSSRTPLVSLTRLRTSSPRDSRSAAVASP